MTIAKSLAIFLLAGGMLLWGASKLPRPSFLGGAAFAGPPAQPAAALVAAGESKLPASDDGYTSLEGTVVLDTNTTPATPFIAYLYKEGVTRTKQLLLSGRRGCDTEVGDLPCVAGTYNDQYPDLAPGERVRVTGVIKGDQMLVERIESL